MTIAPDAHRELVRYRWPGNVRELVNVLEWAVVRTPGDMITTAQLPEQVLTPCTGAAETSIVPVVSLDELARRHIELAVTECGTFEAAAARLSINPTTLSRRRKPLGLH